MRLESSEFAKNGRIGVHGLNCIFFFNSELILEILDENYPMKKIHVSPTILKFSSSNLAGSYLNLIEKAQYPEIIS